MASGTTSVSIKKTFTGNVIEVRLHILPIFWVRLWTGKALLWLAIRALGGVPVFIERDNK